MNKEIFIAVVLLLVVVLAPIISRGSYAPKGFAAGAPAEWFFLEPSQFPLRTVTVMAGQSYSEGQINGVRKIMAHRLALQIAQARIDKAYDQITDRLTAAFGEQLTVKRKPEGISIKLKPVDRRMSSEELSELFGKIQRDVFVTFPYLDYNAHTKVKQTIGEKKTHTAILTFKAEDLTKIEEQTVKEQIANLQKLISPNSEGQLVINAPDYSLQGFTMMEYLCHAGQLFVGIINERLETEPGEEVLPVKFSDRISTLVKARTERVYEIERLNDKISGTRINIDTRFNEWAVVVDFNEAGKEFYADLIDRRKLRRSAYILDSGEIGRGREIIFTDVVEHAGEKKYLRFPVNSFYEANALRNVIMTGTLEGLQGT